MEIINSVAFVTGANRGLGLEFARALLAAGASKVYAAARDPSTITLAGVIPIKLDVTRADEIAAAAKACGDVTLLINNAGMSGGSALLSEGSSDTAQRELQTNFFGPLDMTRAFAPILAKNGGGAIVNMLSILSWLHVPGWSTYSVSKAAAWSMTNGLRIELANQKTQVVGVHVAYMDTDMTRGVDAQKMQPADVARQTLDAIIAGEVEVLADPMTAHVRQALGTGIYLGTPPAP